MCSGSSRVAAGAAVLLPFKAQHHSAGGTVRVPVDAFICWWTLHLFPPVSLRVAAKHVGVQTPALTCPQLLGWQSKARAPPGHGRPVTRGAPPPRAQRQRRS